MAPHGLIVNGNHEQVDVAETTPLLFVLRNDLGLFGAKLGCGQGNCGACTVLVNGRAVQSCSTPVGQVNGAAITTLEGLESDDVVRAAFLDHQAAQCAFCIPGIIMTVRGLADRSGVSRQSLIAALEERHLCRCGAHARILKAAREALTRSGGFGKDVVS